MVGVLADGPAHLRRQDDAVATVLDRLADDDLGLAVRIGGVDEVDPCVQRLVDDADRVVVVRVADRRPEHHRAERVGADFDAGPAEGAVQHGVSPELAGRERSQRCPTMYEVERFSTTVAE